MKILVTGANGMLGKDLCPILQDEGYDVIETDKHNLDITNLAQVTKVLNEEKPDIVIHCASYTQVDKAEDEPDITRLINSKGTENIAKVCAEIDSTLVYISTDYVFDGKGINGEKRTTPYLPTDKSNPLNVYGLTKLEGEKAVRKYCKKYYIVRSSWLYGIHGKNFVETILSLKDMPEIKVVDDQAGCPTWTVDLSEGIAELLKSNEYGIYHICGGGQTSWYNFAGEILTLDGASVNIKPCSTEEYPRKAKRPHYSVMDNNGSCRDWKSALKEYMQLRNMED